MGSDSEDSDEEGGLGNVNRLIIRPAGHSGKAKKGNLCFDAAFETGNLGRVDLVGEFEYDLFLRPDTCNPRYRFWFNFTVDNTKQDQRVIFNIINMNKNNNLYNQGMTPLVKASSRPKWQRIPKHHTFYYKSPVHQNHYILSFAFVFDREEEIYQFALTYPYSYSRLQSYLSVLEQKYPFERESLINSVQQRRLELITFDDVKKPEIVEPGKNAIRVIVVMARIHPSESPTSLIVQGLIEFLAIANHPIAKLLRENVVFKILPMLNPDGVFLGNNRVNCLGHDLNRYWNNISFYTHPTMSATMDMLKAYDTSECYQVDFVIDIHAHTSLMGCFIYGNAYEDVYRYERHLVFPKLFSTKCADFSNENMIFNADDRKQGTARRYLCNRLSDNVNSYTLEVSMNGYYIKGTTVVHYTEADYMKIGRNLARAFLEYYRFTNILPIPPLCDILSKRKGRPKTHRPRRKLKNIYQLRPKTTRAEAPINYTDLSIYYDSDTSAEYSSPARYPFHSNFMLQHTRLQKFPPIHDPYSLSQLKLGNLDLTVRDRKVKPKSSTTVAETYASKNEIISIPPKPYLSIIDFNLLTRGGLEEATSKPGEKVCPHHYQKLRTLKSLEAKGK